MIYQSPTSDSIKENSIKRGYMIAVIAVSLFLLLFIFSCEREGWAENILLTSTKCSDEQICQAIYWAEGGVKTNHPYGILAHYKHTTPKQACLNTVKHKRDTWVSLGMNGDFIDYLGSKYCPINSNTDNGTCKFWPTNVKWYLEHPKR